MAKITAEPRAQLEEKLKEVEDTTGEPVLLPSH